MEKNEGFDFEYYKQTLKEQKDEKIMETLMQLVMMYRRDEKEGKNGIKAFLKDNRKKEFGYKFKATTIAGIKKAIVNYEDNFEIVLT